MEEKKKDNTKILLIVIIILLSLIIVGMGGYIVYNNFINVYSDNPKEEKKNEIPIDVREKLITKIQNNEYLYFNELNQNVSNVNGLQASDLVKYGMSLTEERDIHTLDRVIKSHLYINKTIDYNMATFITCPRGLGSKYEYIYNETTGEYDFNPEHGEHSDQLSNEIFYVRYVDSMVKDDIYTLKVNLFFPWFCEDICMTLYGEIFDSYYNNYSEPIVTCDLSYSDDFGTFCNDEEGLEAVKQYKGDARVYTYVFKKVNDSYILMSYQQ